MAEEFLEIVVNVVGQSPTDLNASLRNQLAESRSPLRVRLQGLNQQDNLVTGLPGIQIIAEGSVGNYCFVALKDADVEIQGSADAALAHSMESGLVIARGNVGPNAGALSSGGLLVIHGNAASRCGAGLRGADIVVEGSVGSYCGLGMQAGTIVVFGNMGPMAGWGSSGGTFFVHGEVETPAPALVESRLKDADKLRLGLLLLNSGLDSKVREFRKFVCDPANS